MEFDYIVDLLCMIENNNELPINSSMYGERLIKHISFMEKNALIEQSDFHLMDTGIDDFDILCVLSARVTAKGYDLINLFFNKSHIDIAISVRSAVKKNPQIISTEDYDNKVQQWLYS